MVIDVNKNCREGVKRQLGWGCEACNFRKKKDRFGKCFQLITFEHGWRGSKGAKQRKFLGRGKQVMHRPSGKCMLSRSGTRRDARVARRGKEGGRVVGFRGDEKIR